MKQEIADKMFELWNERGWWSGPADLFTSGSILCLGVCIVRAVRELGEDAKATETVFLDIRRAIGELFPDYAGGSVPVFNDSHSFEDVSLVVKHAVTRE